MKKPRHASAVINAFEVENGELVFAGIPLSRLAEQIGQTPFYAYDRASITRRVAHLRDHLPSAIHIHYAIKANPMPALVQHLSGLIDGFDLASGGEMRLALDTTMPVANISFAGPGKSIGEIRSAIAAGVTLNLESNTELDLTVQQGEQLGITPRVALRINPDFELKSSGMKMGGGPKPFGVDEEQASEMLQRIGSLGLDFQGLHIFSGSQNLNPQAIIEAQKNTLALACRLMENAPAPLKTINLGGGFGIPYFPGDEPLDLRPIGESLQQHLTSAESLFPGIKLVLELGRYLVGEAGIYVCRVLDKKVSRGEVFLISDGGLHHHLAASGNFGQVIRKNFPLCIGNRMEQSEREVATVVGRLCTPLDVLADRMELPVAEVGDLVVIQQSGAYGLSASPTAFLSHPPPAEVLV